MAAGAAPADRLVRAGPLQGVIEAILERDGCDEAEARVVAEHLVEASLSGHDSHGVVRVPRYHDWIRAGQIAPRRPLEVVMETDTILQLDGHSGMGQRLAREATAMGIAKARAHGLALVALRRAGHVGRVGAYAEQACAEGLVSLHLVNVAGAEIVAPFGSRRRATSTNPVTIGVPNAEGGDFILDFATSMVAEGKALVASRGGKPLPEGALVDEAGRVTRDPRALYGDTLDAAVPDPRAGPGALRAMGEHKGSGLALACELLAGALTGNGTNGPGARPFGNGMLSVLLDPARLDDRGGFAGEVAAYVDHVRALMPAQGVEAVLIPGDRERRLRAERRRDGLPLPERVLGGILAVARELGVEVEEGALLADGSGA